jgi:hypothetical protein
MMKHMRGSRKNVISLLLVLTLACAEDIASGNPQSHTRSQMVAVDWPTQRSQDAKKGGKIDRLFWFSDDFSGVARRA